jgi:hypothetical protein
MFVRGIVGDREDNSGVIDNPGSAATPWHTVHVMIGSERVKFACRVDPATGAVAPKYGIEIPSEGARVECTVDLDLKQSPNSLLRPFRLEIVAIDCTVLETADERDDARSLRSVESKPARKARASA